MLFAYKAVTENREREKKKGHVISHEFLEDDRPRNEDRCVSIGLLSCPRGK